ncbi:hypothetical protein [Aliifodinibius sp. S!AR15-10]|nr:hypothetical protein [Aliifodinibius sp. S!AR15-10]
MENNTEKISKEAEPEQRERREYEKLDEDLMQTFLASDPISYY